MKRTAKGKGRAVDVALDDSSDFRIKSLSVLDASLRCPICQELFVGPVILTSCSHTFCSICVRQALSSHDSPHCPACSTPADEGRLRKNIAVEDAVKAWTIARTEVLQLERDKLKADSSAAAQNNGSVPVHESSDIEIIDSTPPPTRARKRVKIDDPNVQVECPICQKKLKNAEVAQHIQQKHSEGPSSKSAWSSVFANGSSTATSMTRSGAAKRNKTTDVDKKIPLTSYANLKIKDIKELLQDVGLSATVPSQVQDKVAYLKRRHKQWTALWNANTDVSPSDPRKKTHDQLATDLAEWERLMDADEAAKRAAASKPAADHLSTVSLGAASASGSGGGGGGGPTTMSNRAYVRQHKEQFAELVKLARESEMAQRRQKAAAASNSSSQAVDKVDDDSKVGQGDERDSSAANDDDEDDEGQEEDSDDSILKMPPPSQIPPGFWMRNRVREDEDDDSDDDDDDDEVLFGQRSPTASSPSG